MAGWTFKVTNYYLRAQTESGRIFGKVFNRVFPLPFNDLLLRADHSIDHLDFGF